MEKLLRQHRCIVERSTCNRGAGGKIGEQKAPGRKDAEDRRQRVRRVGVERSRRCRKPREAADAKANQQHGARCQQINKPCGVAGKSENQRDCKGGRCAGRHGGNRLGQGFNRAKHSRAQAVVLRRALTRVHFAPRADLARHGSAFRSG